LKRATPVYAQRKSDWLAGWLAGWLDEHGMEVEGV